jgi:hypothetical protein
MSPPPVSLIPRLRLPAVRRRTASWLALLALLIGAVVPTLSRLAQPGEADAWRTLCQARGSTPPDRTGPHEFGDACALCTLAHTTPGLAGAAAVALPAVDYAPPPPVAPPGVRTRIAQARAPGARGPPATA